MKTTFAWKKIVASGAVAIAIVIASLSPSSAFLDKTRFVTHLGVAYFCFHHWVLKPYQEGAFSQDAPHRTASMVKGGAAMLFAYHEVRVAKKVADNSRSPLLQKISGGLDGLMASMGGVGQSLKSGHFNPADIENLKGLTGAFGSKAAENGANIHDVPVAIPGT